MKMMHDFNKLSPLLLEYLFLIVSRMYGITAAALLSFQVITKANNTLNGISSSSVCTEVIQSAQGMEYLLGEELL